MCLHKRQNITVKTLKTYVQYSREESFKNFGSTKGMLYLKLNELSLSVKGTTGQNIFSPEAA